MYIVMHCGGMPFNGDTIKEKSLGGSETAAYYMARELVRRGHVVSMFTNEQCTGMFDGVRYEWLGTVSNEAPLGDRFTFYATKTPHDILIIQRHPAAFQHKFASKMNFWWVHDLALMRVRGMVGNMLHNVDKILTVSAWHQRQVMEVYGLDSDIVRPIQNGIDLSLFEGDITTHLVEYPGEHVNLLYTSRPERGLENLVRPGGIMDKLRDREDIHLYICGYDNTTPQMEAYYEQLAAWADALPNVTRLGALTKQELADTMRLCTALVYPTQFEEVSCITAMEAMAAGMPMITSKVAALPETCRDTGTKLIELEKDGSINLRKFEQTIRELKPVDKFRSDKQRQAAQRYSWDVAAGMVLSLAEEVFRARNSYSLAHHFLRHSDIVPFQKVLGAVRSGAAAEELELEWRKGYGFYRDNTYAAHYEAYYEYEKNRGVNYGPEDVTRTSRFVVVSKFISMLPAGSRVMDYGCAHGHYTVALARMYPSLKFTGVDIAQSNVDKATAWAAQEELTNVVFVRGDISAAGEVEMADLTEPFDAIIAAEVIEHVGHPVAYINALEAELKPTGRMIITVPFGPWEAQGYREHGYWRAHLHHFERQDLQEMLGHRDGYEIIAATHGMSKFASQLGSYIVSYIKGDEACRQLDYDRKIAQTVPDQTVSCCMIVKDGAMDIARCLRSVLPHVQEVIIGVDSSTTDDTATILEKIAADNPLVAFKVFSIPPALTTGFAAARNATLEHASCDWILWVDADEELVNGEAIAPFLRNNMFGGYGVEQHHLSMDPMGVIKVDLPCRLFRNGRGVQFFGYVHEHPETELNRGLGPVMILPHVKIAHHGYVNEQVRRRRFDRNIGLLMRDRQEYPERLLGKFLFLRDLAQMCTYDIEAGAADRQLFTQRAGEGIRLWLELLDSGNLRLALDGLQFYSQLVEVLGGGVEFGFKIDAALFGNRVDLNREQQVVGLFIDIAHIHKLLALVVKSKTEGFGARYI